MSRFAPSLLGFLGLVLCAWGCGSSSTTGDTASSFTDKYPRLALLDSAVLDFGTIREGDIVTHTFRFKNEGEFPLIIQEVTASCGCTVPEWPRDPIAPGAESGIKIQFDSKHKAGPQARGITVIANTEPPYTQLSLVGLVEALSDSLTTVGQE